jgi:hypothetical protein
MGRRFDIEANGAQNVTSRGQVITEGSTHILNAGLNNEQSSLEARKVKFRLKRAKMSLWVIN